MAREVPVGGVTRYDTTSLRLPDGVQAGLNTSDPRQGSYEIVISHQLNGLERSSGLPVYFAVMGIGMLDADTAATPRL